MNINSFVKLLRPITSNVAIGVFITDLEGKCILVNEKWQEIAKMTYDQAMGDGWAEAIFEEDRDWVSKAWQTAASSGDSFVEEYRFGSKGNTSWVRGTAGVLELAGIKVGHIGTIEDITTEKQLGLFFQYAVDLFAIADQSGHFIRVNPAFNQQLGWDSSELIGKPFIDFVHEDDKAETRDVYSRLAPGKELANFINRYQCKGADKYKILEWTSYTDSDGLIYATARDITEEQKLKQDLATKLEETEIMNKAMIDRELRMTELKQEVERLKGLLGGDVEQVEE